MDDRYGPEHLTPETRDAMRDELIDFVDGCEPVALDFWLSELGPGQVGHDFWLTRNGHGAGFWDRFMDGPGELYGGGPPVDPSRLEGEEPPAVPCCRRGVDRLLVAEERR